MNYRKIHRILNTVIALCIFGFVVIFLKGPAAEHRLEDGEPVLFGSGKGWSSQEWHAMSKEVANESRADVSDLSGWNFQPKFGNSTLSGRDIVSSVNFLNENFDILNVDKFGKIEDVSYILVIQVHNRPTYLKYLIESLRATKNIERTLLVFSHDINVGVINEMIRNITFARVYQIFYPFNMQLFPNVFPGQSLEDCPEKIGKTNAEKKICKNWKWPDKYGNYRVAKLTQIKHHWWWKMNFVFDGIVQKYGLQNSWVLLLEEDHFVTPDALHVLDIIVDNKHGFCDKCEIISLGFYLKTTNKYGADIAKLGVHPWYSSKHNMGMSLQFDTWKKIRNCSKMFCEWDDYNWDWSLMQVSAKCLPQRFRVVFAKSPRVIHIGDCGVHTHRCDAHNAYEATTELLKSHSEKLFPSKLTVTDISRRSLKPSKENGGWGDVRDRELCEINSAPLASLDPQSVLSDVMSSQVRVPNRP